MLFEEIPEWAIAGPVVYDSDAPIFVRHQIHKEMSRYYRDIDDILFIESIVRKYVADFKKSQLTTIDQLKSLLVLKRK